MSQKSRKQQWQRRQSIVFRTKPLFVYSAIAVLLIGAIAGIAFTFSSPSLSANAAQRLIQTSNNSNQTIAEASNAASPPCPHTQGQVLAAASQPRSETTLSLDLTADGVPAFWSF